jgi:cell wall-associated NlpC family hydrolase
VNRAHVVRARPHSLPGALALVALAAATLLAPGLAGARAASADTVASAQAQAAALATQVSELRSQTEAATEAYDEASGALVQAVGAQLAAEQAVAQAQTLATQQTEAAANQARTLYESGGPLSTYAALMRSGDPGDLVTGVQGEERHAARLRDLGAQAEAARDAASERLRELAAVEQHRSDLQAAAQAQAAKVTALLARQSTLLDQANAQVRQLEQQEEQRRLIANEVAFLRRYELAQALAGHQHGHVQMGGLTLAGTGDLSLATGATTGGGPIPGTDPAAIHAVLSTISQAADATAASALEAILTHLGSPYLWGGTGPSQFDCSGLTGAAYAAAGLLLPRTAAQQYLAGIHPALTDLRPGDLLFWADDPKNPATIHHVAMYAGGDLMVSTDHTGDVARIQPIWADGFAGATRPVPALAAAVAGPFWSPGTT